MWVQRRERKRIIQWLAAGVLVVALCAGVGVYTANRHMVDIKAQDVGAALLELAVQTRTQLVFSPALIEDGSRCPEVKGFMTLKQAMQAILADSNIRFEYSSGQVVLLPDRGKLASHP